MDMFWGDRCGAVVDPEVHLMVATHIAQPQPRNATEDEGNKWPANRQLALRVALSSIFKLRYLQN